MGAETFFHKTSGSSINDAFRKAVEEAHYDFGHRGYTGSIAEKDSFVKIALPDGKDAEDYANELIDECDSRVDDKWGPAGCIQVNDNEYLFFGWASS